jgi:hypothetical protein
MIPSLLPHDQHTDPAVAFIIPMWQMLSVTNDGLVGYRRVGGPLGDTLVPDLAQALPAPASNGLTYTFHLRPGIRYSTGALVRPEDFRRAIERVFSPEFRNRLDAYYAGIAGARACEQAPSRAAISRAGSSPTTGPTDHLPPDRTRPGIPLQSLLSPSPTPSPRNAQPPHWAQPVACYRPLHDTVVRAPASLDPCPQPAVPPVVRPSATKRLPRPDRAAARRPPGLLSIPVERGSADVLLSPSPARLPELATRYAGWLHSGRWAPRSGSFWYPACGLSTFSPRGEPPTLPSTGTSSSSSSGAAGAQPDLRRSSPGPARHRPTALTRSTRSRRGVDEARSGRPSDWSAPPEHEALG